MTDYAEYIKERVSIVDVVERAGVNLKHNKACCPFHHEKRRHFQSTLLKIYSSVSVAVWAVM